MLENSNHSMNLGLVARSVIPIVSLGVRKSGCVLGTFCRKLEIMRLSLKDIFAGIIEI